MTEQQAAMTLREMLTKRLGNADPTEQIAVEKAIEALEQVQLLRGALAGMESELTRAEERNVYLRS